ncbi:MAG: hypothetical protein HON23_00760 [Rickettsiales bacterium]|jgi:hypothetical protein|nr:hypothetical protein [Rickettsiales bacterium]
MSDGLSAGQILSSQASGGGAAASGQPFSMETAIGAEQFELGGDPMTFFKGKLGGEGLEGFGAKGVADMVNDSSMVKAAIGSAPEFNKGSPGMAANISPPSTPMGDSLNISAGFANKGGGQGH